MATMPSLQMVAQIKRHAKCVWLLAVCLTASVIEACCVQEGPCSNLSIADWRGSASPLADGQARCQQHPARQDREDLCCLPQPQLRQQNVMQVLWIFPRWRLHTAPRTMASAKGSSSGTGVACVRSQNGGPCSGGSCASGSSLCTRRRHGRLRPWNGTNNLSIGCPLDPTTKGRTPQIGAHPHRHIADRTIEGSTLRQATLQTISDIRSEMAIRKSSGQQLDQALARERAARQAREAASQHILLEFFATARRTFQQASEAEAHATVTAETARIRAQLADNETPMFPSEATPLPLEVSSAILGILRQAGITPSKVAGLLPCLGVPEPPPTPPLPVPVISTVAAQSASAVSARLQTPAVPPATGNDQGFLALHHHQQAANPEHRVAREAGLGVRPGKLGALVRHLPTAPVMLPRLFWTLPLLRASVLLSLIVLLAPRCARCRYQPCRCVCCGKKGFLSLFPGFFAFLRVYFLFWTAFFAC